MVQLWGMGAGLGAWCGLGARQCPNTLRARSVRLGSKKEPGSYPGSNRLIEGRIRQGASRHDPGNKVYADCRRLKESAAVSLQPKKRSKASGCQFLSVLKAWA